MQQTATWNFPPAGKTRLAELLESFGCADRCRRTRGRGGFRQESRRPDQAGSTRSKHSVPKRERHRPVAPSAAECPTIGPTYNGRGSDRLSITAGCRRRTRVVGVR